MSTFNKQDKARGRVLEPNFKFQVETKWHRRFTWKDRFLIFFGCPVKVTLVMWTEHHTGKFHPILDLRTIPEQEMPK
jgi:hypothetical protein